MWMKVPDTITEVLWEASLEPTDQDAVDRLRREWAALGVTRDARGAVRSLPAVTIGHPEVWALPEVYPPHRMPAMLRGKLDENDFYLVRLACSFRTRRKRVEVEWARFLVRFLPDNARRLPTAFDLHPLRVTQEVRRNVRVTIGPSLKFQEVNVGVGEIAFGIEYSELQPIISAAGVGESEPSWDYEEARGTMVQGAKHMHLLLKVPKGMDTVRATLDLVADVSVYGSRLSAVFPSTEEVRRHLTVRLV